MRSLIATLLLSAGLFAQTVPLQAIPSTIPGIRLIPPGDAQFANIVKGLIPEQRSLDAIQSMLSQSVIVANDLPTPLMSFTVVFQVTDASGRVGTINPGLFTEMRSPVLQPGGQYLISTDQGVMDKARATGTPPSNFTSVIAGATKLTASIDSITLPDGRFIGPDVANNFSRFSAELNSALTLCEGVRAHRSDLAGATAFLKQQAAQEMDSAITPLRATAMLGYLQARGLPDLAAHCDADVQIWQSVHLRK